MPKWIVRKFQGMLKEKMIGGLCPENMTKAKAIADIEIGLKVGDHQVMGIMFYILHILCYLDARKRTMINAHTIKYETLLSNPKEELEKIVQILNKGKDNVDYELCLKALGKDSQAKSEDISKEKLAEFKKKNPITPELIDKIDTLFKKYGLPSSKTFDDLFY